MLEAAILSSGPRKSSCQHAQPSFFSPAASGIGGSGFCGGRPWPLARAFAPRLISVEALAASLVSDVLDAWREMARFGGTGLRLGTRRLERFVALLAGSSLAASGVCGAAGDDDLVGALLLAVDETGVGLSSISKDRRLQSPPVMLVSNPRLSFVYFHAMMRIGTHLVATLQLSLRYRSSLQLSH